MFSPVNYLETGLRWLATPYWGYSGGVLDSVVFHVLHSDDLASLAVGDQLIDSSVHHSFGYLLFICLICFCFCSLCRRQA